MILLTTNHVIAASRKSLSDFEDYSKYGDGHEGDGAGDGGGDDRAVAAEYTPPHVKMCVSQMYLVMQLLEPEP